MDGNDVLEATTVEPDPSYPPLVDEDNAYDDIYLMPGDLDPTTTVEPLITNPTPRTLGAPPDDYHPVMKALHYYFGELYIQIEFYCHQHYIYILIGLAVFLFLIVIPGVCAQIYCDRLYRKYKREAITRKILEVEAQLQSTMELEAELDNPAHRPDRRQYESSSSSESDDSYDRKRRKRRKDRKSKSGKKVRAKSRNNKQDPEYEKAKHKMELMELEAQAKVEEVKHATIEKKENHRRHHPDSGFNSHQNQTTELFNDKPPTYSSKHRQPTSAAIQTGSLFEEESVVEVLPHYDDCIELTKSSHPSGEFLLQSETLQTEKTIPVAVATIKPDVVKQTSPRSAFWSAGVIQQFNGVKTPPIPKKTIKKEATPPAVNIIQAAAAHNAAPIKYEEIGLMDTMYQSGVMTGNKPTDYNAALLSITHRNDDAIGAHRAHQARIAELMPPPDEKQQGQPGSLEPLYRSPTPPPLPTKETKKKSGLKAMNNVPDMEMGRTFHTNAAPTNDYEGEIVDKTSMNGTKKRTTVMSRTTSKEMPNEISAAQTSSMGGDDLTTIASSITNDTNSGRTTIRVDNED